MNFVAQQQIVPGTQGQMNPVPDCGEDSYRGSGKLTGKRAIITGGDSGIGRAVAIAFAREGADVLISYLSEDEDARDVARYVEDAGRRCVLVPGDLSDAAHCRAVVDRAVREFGGIDILVDNAAYQMMHKRLDEISDEEWDYTFRLNVGAYFHPTKAALPHMGVGSSIIGSSSVNSDTPGTLCRDQGGDRQSLGQPRSAAGRQRNSRQQRCARPDMDSADPGNHARGQRGILRRQRTVGTRRPTRRAGSGIRAAGLR